MSKKLIGTILATSAALAFSTITTTSTLANSKVSGAKVTCYGINACQGKSACTTANKGKNSCKGKGVVRTTAKNCAKKGGSTTAPTASDDTSSHS